MHANRGKSRATTKWERALAQSGNRWRNLLRPGRAPPGSGLLDLLDAPLDDLVDQAEFLRRFGREEIVALQRFLDLLDALAGVLHVDFVEPLANAQDFLGVNHDV